MGADIYREELQQIMRDNWVHELFASQPTRMLILFLTSTSFIQHKKKDVADKLGICTASLYRGINTLKKFNLVLVDPKSIMWNPASRLGKLILVMGSFAGAELMINAD